VSSVAKNISKAVPEVIARSPDSCCGYNGRIAVYVTHALPSDCTPSGFELFWDKIYAEIARTSSADNICFVMTGANPPSGGRT
jgi:hypothetical protein